MSEADQHYPDARGRRAMLTLALQQMREQTYGARINLIVAEAQTGKSVNVPTDRGTATIPREEHIQNLRETVENGRRVVARLAEELASIPEPPPADA